MVQTEVARKREKEVKLISSDKLTFLFFFAKPS
jgi:hypothetical protein